MTAVGVLLQPPLIFLLLAGLGCSALLVTALVDAVRKVRDPTRGHSRLRRSRLRFAGSLVLLALLGFFTFQLFAAVVRMAPSLAYLQRLEGSPVPAVTYTRIDAEGSPAEDLDALRERVVLLNIWATWCPPCRKEMPELEQLQVKLGPRGLTVLHLSQEPLDRLEAWLLENPMTTRHGRLAVLPLPVPALPTSLVIDRQGIVRDVLVGGKSLETFGRAVEPWL